MYLLQQSVILAEVQQCSMTATVVGNNAILNVLLIIARFGDHSRDTAKEGEKEHQSLSASTLDIYLEIYKITKLATLGSLSDVSRSLGTIRKRITDMNNRLPSSSPVVFFFWEGGHCRDTI